jgi:carbamoylphosphate synthase large subunit
MKVLFIGARLFDDVALYTKKQGITTILTESNPKSPNLKLADTSYLVSRGMDEPREIALNEDVDAVVPLMGVDGPLKEVAQMKEELEKNHGLPVVASGVKAASISTDKIKTKEFFLKHNIRTPKFSKINDNDFKKFKDNLSHEIPLVFKHAQGQGGSGIKIVSNESDIHKYLHEFKDGMVEEFVCGTEVSVEVLRWKKKSVPLVPVYKGKTTLEGIHPLDKIKKAPLKIDGIDNQQNNYKIREIADKIADLLKIEGTADIDLIFHNEPKHNYVIEINVRPSGTRYITSASSNINPLHQLVDMASGSWKASKVTKRMKEYSALEIPVGDYDMSRNNFKFRDFSGANGWIIHGPEHFQRVTIRGPNEKKAFKTAKNLKINFNNH